jgi:MFS transporter
VEEHGRPGGDGRVGRVERDRLVAVLAQAQVGDDLRLEHRDDVRRARDAIAGPELLGDARAAEHVAALEHADVEPRAGQVGGRGERVVAPADDDGTVTDDFVSLPHGRARRQTLRRAPKHPPRTVEPRHAREATHPRRHVRRAVPRPARVSIVNVALPSTRAELQPSAAGLQWVVDGYAIALASLMLAGGTIGDLHGHRRVVLAGLALFGLASAAAGAAPTNGVLVAARIVQGADAALLLPGTLAIITHAFPEPRARPGDRRLGRGRRACLRSRSSGAAASRSPTPSPR